MTRLNRHAGARSATRCHPEAHRAEGSALSANVRLAVLVGALAAAACRPALAPLTGVPVPAEKLPRPTLAPGHRKIVFTWELEDREMTGRGDGVARIAAPDSARLDFFLAGGFGGGAAILIRDSVDAPGGDMVR